MATTPGQRFVRRHNAARSSTSNTTAADISYDTAVISEGGYSWSSPEVTVDEAGLYLCIYDIGEVQLASTRAVGTLVPSVNTTDQTYYKARHRYLRNSGGNHNASWGACILDLSASDDVKIRNPGTVTGTDAVGNYATNSGQGGGFQMIRLNAGNFTEVRRGSNQSMTITYANATRPWLDSTPTLTQVTFTSEVRDDDGLYPGTGGDLTLAANTKYLIVYGGTMDGTSAQRHTHNLVLDIAGNNVQRSTGYCRNAGSEGPPMQGMYLHETGGSSETLKLHGYVEQEDNAVSNTVNLEYAYLQVLELPSSAEWIHVDNGTTDSLTTAWAGTSTYYDTPLSSTLRADGDSNLSLDSGNNAVQNDSGGSLPVLAIGWMTTDRDSGASGTRKHVWSYWDNGGTRLAYGISGGYNRGQQGNDDTFQLAFTGAATMDLANAADLSFVSRDPQSGANSDMGVYASTSRYFLGVQVLNLNTLEDSGTDVVAEPPAGSLSVTGATPSLHESVLMRPGILHAGNRGLYVTGITPTIDVTTGTDETAEPPAGDLDLTGLAPTPGEDHVIGVPSGSLSISGQAPTAEEIHVSEMPTASVLQFSLFAPSAEEDHIRGPPQGTLQLAANAPSAEEAHIRQIPSAGSLELQGYAPSVLTSINLAVPAGGLNLNALTPSAEELHVAEMPVGSLSLTEFTPGIYTEIGLPAGLLSLSGLAPTLQELHVAEMPAGSLTLASDAPVAFSGDSKFAQPPEGVCSLTGLTPSAEIEHNRDVPVGSLTLTGLQGSAEEDHIRAVPVGSLSCTGYAPTASVPASGDVVEVFKGELNLVGGRGLRLDGYQPTVLASLTIEIPNIGRLELASQAPNVVTDSPIIQIPAGELRLRSFIGLRLDGYAPDTIVSTTIPNPDVGVLTLTGRTPVIGGDALREPPAGDLTLTGLEPNLSIGAPGGVTETPPSGSLALTGRPPALELVINDALSSLFFTGYTSNVSLDPTPPPTSASPPVGSLELTGYTPERATGLLLRGYEPSVFGDIIIEIPTPPGGDPEDPDTTIFFTGYEPAAFSENPIIEMPFGQLSVTGYAPSLPFIATPDRVTLDLTGLQLAPLAYSWVITPDTGALRCQGHVPGEPRRKGGRVRKPRRLFVEIDGQLFEVASQQEAIEMLQQAREVAEDQAEVLESAPKIRVITRAGTPSKSKAVQAEVKRVQSSVNRAFDRARAQAERRAKTDREIALLMALKLKEEQDEEEALLALLLS